MDDLGHTPAGQTALDLTRRLDPAALAMVEAILRGDLEATRAGAWAWGVLGHAAPDEALAALSRAVGDVTHRRAARKRGAEEQDVALDEAARAPIVAAGDAVSQVESERGAVLPAHRAARVEAERATAAGAAAAQQLRRTSA